jgi:hypothetical protein
VFGEMLSGLALAVWEGAEAIKVSNNTPAKMPVRSVSAIVTLELGTNNIGKGRWAQGQDNKGWSAMLRLGGTNGVSSAGTNGFSGWQLSFPVLEMFSNDWGEDSPRVSGPRTVRNV